MRIGKLLTKSISTCTCFFVASYSLAEGVDQYNKELLEINSKIKAAFDANDLKSTLPLYERAIEILRKIGRKQDIYAALKNYEAAKQQVLSQQGSDDSRVAIRNAFVGSGRTLHANSYESQPKRELPIFESDRSKIEKRSLLFRGNIVPYQKEAISRIARNWKLQRSSGRWAVNVEIARDGKVLATHLVTSTSASEGRDATKVIETTAFAPLPEWFQDSRLTFEVTSETIMALVK